MKTELSLWRKASIIIISLAVVFYTGFSVPKTGAWFVDGGTLVTANYGIGVIDYTVYIDGKDIEKIKEGQQVSVAVPIIGAAKINDDPKPVVINGNTHDEFDEGVTLIRTKIVNKGGLPIGISVRVDTKNLTGGGILAMVVPYGHEVDPKQYGVKRTTTGTLENYKTYIKTNLEKPDSNWGTYDELSKSVEDYLEKIGSAGTKNRVVAYPGKLPSVLPENVTQSAVGLTVDTLCWAEYDKMEYSTGDKATDNAPGNPMIKSQGQLIFTITCTL